MRRLQACLLALVLLWGCAHAVQFEVSSRTTKCIAEEIQANVVVVGDYKIVHSDDTHKITVKVLECSAFLLSHSMLLVGSRVDIDSPARVLLSLAEEVQQKKKI